MSELAKKDDKLEKLIISLESRKENFINENGSIVGVIAEYVNSSILDMVRHMEDNNALRLSREFAKHKSLVWKKFKSVDEKHQLFIDRQDILEDDLDNINRALKTFKHDTTGIYGKYKKAAQSRVMSIVGGKSTPQFELFYRSFIMKNYGNACYKLGASNNDSIFLEDGSEAIRLVKTWTPDRKYINDKILELSSKRDKGMLNKEKEKAFDLFMEQTEGGQILPF